MDINYLLQMCGKDDDVNRETYSQIIASNAGYLDMESDDVCVDLQTLFNTKVNSGTSSYGSSGAYMYTPPYEDNNGDLSIKRGKGYKFEHFTNITTNNFYNIIHKNSFVVLILIIVGIVYYFCKNNVNK